MIINYKLEKGYSLGSLQNKIFLYPRKSSKMIYSFDELDGEAMAQAIICDESLELEVGSASFNVATSEENRYLFQSTLEFTLVENENMTYITLVRHLAQEDYIVGIVDKNGDSYIINPEFKADVTYRYAFGDSNSVAVTFTFNQNQPCLLFNGILTASNLVKHNLCQYNLNALKTLKIGYYEDVIIDVKDEKFNVTVNNDALKTIEYGSLTITEDYDGSEYVDTLTFTIPWKAYQYQLHYNILEFVYNKYVAWVSTQNGNNILCGTPMIPSYTIQTSEDNSPNTITITLTSRDSSVSFYANDKVEIIQQSTQKYISVKSECVDDIYSVVIVGELDDNGKENGNYYALKGYDASEYNVVGTYSSIYDTRFGIRLYNPNIQCVSAECQVEGIPTTISFVKVGEYQTFQVKSECEITFRESQDCDIYYFGGVLSITNRSEADYTISYVDGNGYERIIFVNVKISDNHITKNYNVDAREQDYVISLFGDVVDIISINTSLEFTEEGSSSIRFHIPKNEDGNPRVFQVIVNYLDGSSETLNIHQDRIYEIYYVDGTEQCIGYDLWKMMKYMYGYSENNINIDGGYIPYTLTEKVSDFCTQDANFDRQVIGEIVIDGVIWEIVQYIDQDGNLQYERLEKTDRTATADEYERWVVIPDMMECVKGVTYAYEQRYVSNDNISFYPTNEYRISSTVSDKDICGVIQPDKQGMLVYRWIDMNDFYCLEDNQEVNCEKVEATTETICVEGDKYYLKKAYIDTFCNGTWTFSGYELGNLIEENSQDCEQ